MTILPNPQLTKTDIESSGQLKFSLRFIDVSVANAIRRTILNDIPTVVIRSETYEINQCLIEINTSRSHNEVLAHRISCVPIHHNGDKTFCDKYTLEVDENNDSQESEKLKYVTTEHFRLRDKTTNTLIPLEQSRQIFPPHFLTKDFIDIVPLRPPFGTIGETYIPGERLKLKAEFSWATAKDNGMFVVGNVGYGQTIDIHKANEEWEKKKESIIRSFDQNLSTEKKEFILKQHEIDFWALDAYYFYHEDGFDFVIKSFGIYESKQLFTMACDIIIEKLQNISNNIDGTILIFSSLEGKKHGYNSIFESNINNGWDIVLENEDDSIGNLLNYAIHVLYFDKKPSEITYSAYGKFHPHDTYGVLRVAMVNSGEITSLHRMIRESCNELIEVFSELKKIMK